MLEDKQRDKILETINNIHQQVENAYQKYSASKGDKDWPERQRLLLADMATHLLQTALSDGDIQLEKLRNNIHSILTISDLYLPEAKLKKAVDEIYRGKKD